MNTPEMLTPSRVAPDTESLGTYLPVPGGPAYCPSTPL